jgi:hypothetical protein
VITISAALKRSLARAAGTFCTLYRVAWKDGTTVLGFTDFNQDITYDDGGGSVVYKAMSGYTRSDIETSGALNVDNLELDGPLVSPSITEADLIAGLWDFAAIKLSRVNWGDFFIQHPIVTITRSGSTATVTVGTTADLASGDTLVIYGAAQSQYNGAHVITVTGPTHFTYAVSGSPATPATGTLYYQTSMGALIYRVGTLGEVTMERNNFKAELRGLTQAYTRVIGQLTSPSCRTTLGSTLCTVNLTPFTVTGALTGVNADNRTLYDTARTEPGPTAGPSITHITQANPGHVTLGSALDLPNGAPITISGVVGMTNVNTVTTVNNIAGDGLSFDLPIDTSAFPAYTSGGTVTPLGSGSGYFDNGVFTWTSGANNGFSMEVQSYVPGQITLELPVGPPSVGVAVPQVGDTYSLHAGCDYSMATCRDRFNNIVNFRGEPYLPGTDKLLQVGAQGNN